MKYLKQIKCNILSQYCLAFLGLIILSPAAHAAKKVALNTSHPNNKAITANATPVNKVKRGIAKDLKTVQSVGLTQTSQLVSQQSPTDPTPSTSTPEGQTPASDTQTPLPTQPDPSTPNSQTPLQTQPEPSAPNPQPPVIQQTQPEPQLPSPEQVTPNPANVRPGRATRSGSSYVGVGANIGGFGNTSVGNPGLMIYSKIGLTRYFSVRPALVTDFSDDLTFILPATFDFAPLSVARTVTIAPYIGGGATVTTGGDVRPLLMGGIDVPIGSRFTATFGINTTFGDDTDLGGFVGVGYNFR